MNDLIFTKILPLPLTIQETILDIETTGLSPKKDEIISIAYTKQNTIQIHVLKNTNKTNYQDYYQFLSKTLSTLNKPWHIYNAKFEETFFTQKMPELTQSLNDLQEPLRNYCNLARNSGTKIKWPKLTEITQTTLFPYYGVELNDITGKEVSLEWEYYKKDKKTSHLEKIATHNALDIVRSIQLMLWNNILESIILGENHNHPNNLTLNKTTRFMFICDWCEQEKPPKNLYYVQKLHENSEAPPFFLCNECIGS